MRAFQKFPLKAYQKPYVLRFLSQKIGGLPLDCGLGKTRIMLEVIHRLLNAKIINTILVISRKSIVEGVWPQEISKWEYPLTTCLLSEGFKSANIYLINPEQFIRKEQLLIPTDMLILDESTLFKNHTSKRFKILKKNLYKYERRYALTGTLMPRSYENLWPQTYLLDTGERLGTTITKYRNSFFFLSQSSYYTWELKNGCDKIIQALIKDLWYHHEHIKESKVTINIIKIKLESRFKKIYDSMKKEARAVLSESKELIALNMPAKRIALRLLAGGIYKDENNVFHLYSSHKFKELTYLIEELQGKPIIIAYTYNAERDLLLRYFDAKVLQGGMSKIDIEQITTDWNSKKIPILLCQPQVVSHGLNLQYGSNHLCWFSLPDDWETYYQFNKRIDRLDQPESVIIHHLLSINTVDEIIYKALQNKQVISKEIDKALYKNIK